MLKPILCTLVALALCLAVLSIIPFPVYRKWVWVDETTGSKCGHTVIMSLVTVNKWNAKSKFEKALMDIGKPVALRRYVSCEGTGYSILGRAVLHGHGTPTEAAMQIDMVVDGWMAKNSKERLLALVSENANPMEVMYDEGIKIIAQQVDSAEDSTIAVPSSGSSGLPR